MARVNFRFSPNIFSSYENALDLHGMHTATSSSHITASFDESLLQFDMSRSPTPGSSSGEQSPQILNSPIRWEKRHLQPIKIEVNTDAEPIRNQDSPVTNSPLKTQTFFLQPLQNTRENVGRERPLKKVRSLRKIVEDDQGSSDSHNSESKQPKGFDLTYPLVNGEHSISHDIKMMQQNYQSGSKVQDISQGRSKKYKLVTNTKNPLVNGMDYAANPEKCATCKEQGMECSKLSGRLNGDNSNDSLALSFKGDDLDRNSSGRLKRDSWDENMSPTLKRNSWDENLSPRQKRGSWDENFSPRLKGDRPVKFCISNSSDEDDASDSGSVLKAEFVLDI